MTKILIISDTHGDKNIIDDVKNFENPTYTIHAGDFCTNISYISKVTDFFVAGNNDVDGEKIKLFDIDNIKFFLTHGHQYIFFRNKSILNDAKLYGAKIAITGHTHIECVEEKDGIILINPGSLVLPRNSSKERTYVILSITNNQKINYEIKKWKN